MKEFKTTLPIGVSNQGMDLYATMKVEGEEPYRFKCKSFLGNFISSLYGHMTGGRVKRSKPNGNIIENIEDIDIVNTNEVRIRTQTTNINNSWAHREWDEDDPTVVQIFNCEDVFPGITGTYYIDAVSNDTFYPVDENGNRVTTTNTSNASNFNRRCLHWIPQHVEYSNAASNNDQGRFNQWIIQVGYGTTPVKASDQGLDKQIGSGSNLNQMAQSGMSYSVQTTDKPTTRMVLTKTFTNNSGQDIEIKEVGIYDTVNTNGGGTNGWSYLGILLVRDVLGSTQTVPDGKTITIDYEIVFELTPDTQDTDTDGTNGGFIDDFLSLLRTKLIQWDYARNNYFNMAVGGVNACVSDNTDYYKAERYGVLIGTDNTYTSMTNNNLLSKIDQGDQDGELWYYGMNFEPYVIDDVNNEAYFEVFRIFENRGSTSITVAEVGLAGNNKRDTAMEFNFSGQLLARTALAPADQFTIAPGELVKVTYQIKAIV